jgi:hypothetical protein
LFVAANISLLPFIAAVAASIDFTKSRRVVGIIMILFIPLQGLTVTRIPDAAQTLSRFW